MDGELWATTKSSHMDFQKESRVGDFLLKNLGTTTWKLGALLWEESFDSSIGLQVEPSGSSKLTCPGLENQLDWEFNAKRAELRTENLPKTLRSGKKYSELKKVFVGAMPSFLVPKCCYKFTLDHITATNTVKKTKFNSVHFKDLFGFIEWFTNLVSSHSASRKQLWGVGQNGRLLWAEEEKE